MLSIYFAKYLIISIDSYRGCNRRTANEGSRKAGHYTESERSKTDNDSDICEGILPLGKMLCEQCEEKFAI